MNGDARNDQLLPMNLSFARCQTGRTSGPFPLTPTLSRGERENRFPHLELPTTLWLVQRRRRGSLSPRERAGVRGNKTLANPMRQMHPGSRVHSAKFCFRGILSPTLSSKEGEGECATGFVGF